MKTFLRIAALLLASIPLTSLQSQTRIMALGDSITFGWDGQGKPSTGSYRHLLTRLMDDAGIDYDMVGTLNDGPDSGWDKDHEGYSGIKIQELENGGFRDTGYPGIVPTLATHDPDIILLLIGTNNSSQDTASTAITRLTSLVDTIYDQSPGVQLFLANLTPRTSSNIAFVTDYNASLPALVNAQVDIGRKIHLVDLYGSVTGVNISDGVHTTWAGDDIMAEAWFSALTNFMGTSDGNKSPTISITSPAEAATVNGTFTIEADASDPDGSISRVEFLVNGAFVGSTDTVTNGSWSFTLENPPVGTLRLRARAVDNSGATFVGDEVTVTRDGSAPFTNDLIGHWVFNANQDEKVYDASGFGNHMVRGDNAFWTEGPTPGTYGLRIDESNNSNPTYVEHLSEYDAASDFTFTGWIRWEGSTTRFPMIFGQRYSFLVGLYRVDPGDPTAELYLNLRSPSSVSIRSGLSLQANQWHFIAVSKSGTEVIFRIDDDVITKTTSAAPDPNSRDFQIMHAFQPDEGSTATISDFRYYSRGLSTTELTVVKDAHSSTPVAPPPPTNLTATAIDYQQVDLTWTDNSDGDAQETAFVIERSTSSGSGFAQIHSTPADTESYSDTGLDSNTTYYYRIYAANDAGSSANSPESSATTDALTEAQAWRLLYFGTIENVDNALDSYDFDGDGLVNIIERAFMTDPTDPSDSFAPILGVETVSSADYISFTYRRLTGGIGTTGVDYTSSGITYTVEFTEDLGFSWNSGNLTVVEELIDDPEPGLDTVTVRMNDPIPTTGNYKLFMRMKVSQ